MDAFGNSLEILSMASMILVILMNTQRSLSALPSEAAGEDFINDSDGWPLLSDTPALGLNTFSRACLHHWRLWNSLTILDEDLGFWVKPRSTTWFSKFLLEEYDDNRWVQMFRMTKRSVFSLASLLAPTIQKRDTNYRLAIPVPVRVSCTLFKLSHGASLLISSELFAVGRSTVSMMMRDVVHAINVVLRKEISWPSGERITSTATDFQRLCGLPGVLGAIDGTHFAISKPVVGPSDYYYFKSGGYSMSCQAVVDSSKRFLDIFVGMPGSTNDSRMLRRSALFHRGQQGTLWDGNRSFHGFSPFLIGDSGYPLLPWLMVPHRRHENMSVANALFNRRLSAGRGVVENAFALLKQSFRELHLKTELHVTFLPDVVCACALLHSVLLQQSHEDVERLLHVLSLEEALRGGTVGADAAAADGDLQDDVPNVEEGHRKRSDLGVFLSIQRLLP